MANRRHAASSVTAPRLQCLECGAVSDEDARGWRAYIGGGFDDDDPLEVGIYCPACSEREFQAD